jgi:hypothetical protein
MDQDGEAATERGIGWLPRMTQITQMGGGGGAALDLSFLRLGALA